PPRKRSTPAPAIPCLRWVIITTATTHTARSRTPDRHTRKHVLNPCRPPLARRAASCEPHVAACHRRDSCHWIAVPARREDGRVGHTEHAPCRATPTRSDAATPTPNRGSASTLPRWCWVSPSAGRHCCWRRWC